MKVPRVQASILAIFSMMLLSGGFALFFPWACADSGSSIDAAQTDPDLETTAEDMHTPPGIPAMDLGSTDAGACHNLVNAAPIIQQTIVNQPMPSPTSGGTIMPGIYYLTESKIYQGAPPGVVPLRLQATRLINGNTVQTALGVGGQPSYLHDTRIQSTSGTTLTTMSVCPGSGTTVAGFDATPTQYTIYGNSEKVVNVWTRQ